MKEFLILFLPLLGFIALNKFLISDDKSKNKKPLKLAFYIAGGLSLLFALIPSLFFDFVGNNDGLLEAKGWPIKALQADRAILLSADAWRSFIFITLTFGTLWLFLKEKLQSKYVILIVGVLIIADMWPVNKRYLNDSHFTRKSNLGNYF